MNLLLLPIGYAGFSQNPLSLYRKVFVRFDGIESVARFLLQPGNRRNPVQDLLGKCSEAPWVAAGRARRYGDALTHFHLRIELLKGGPAADILLQELEPLDTTSPTDRWRHLLPG